MIVLLNSPHQSCVVETLQIKCFNTKSKSLHSRLRLNPLLKNHKKVAPNMDEDNMLVCHGLKLSWMRCKELAKTRHIGKDFVSTFTIEVILSRISKKKKKKIHFEAIGVC
jgi:hypothetical protein